MAESDRDKSDSYLQKAENIDMSYCTTLKRDKETIDEFKKKRKGPR